MVIEFPSFYHIINVYWFCHKLSRDLPFNRYPNVASCNTSQSILKQLLHLYNLLQVDKQIDFYEQEDVSPDGVTPDIL